MFFYAMAVIWWFLFGRIARSRPTQKESQYMKFQSRSKYLVMAAVAGLAVTAANEPTAQAGTTSDAFDVNAVVLSACLTTTTDVNAGTYDAGGVNATADLLSSASGAPGAVTVTCANGVDFGIALDSGGNAGAGSAGALAMFSATTGEYLGYNLLDDADVPWVDRAVGDYSSTGAAISQQINVSVPTGQTPSAGTDYSDTVNVTVDFI
jgi:spore coat protein U-like protein